MKTLKPGEPKPLAQRHTAGEEGSILAAGSGVTIRAGYSGLISPRLPLLPFHQSFKYMGREAGVEGGGRLWDDPAFLLRKVPRIWNQNLWLQVLAHPGDLGQITLFLFPPMKWGISEGCCETQV